MQHVIVLALPDVILFDLATPAEVFSRVRLPDGRPGYQVTVAGTDTTVTGGPVSFHVDAGLDVMEQADLIVVPGRADPLTPTPPEVLDALRAAHRAGVRIASICVGAFTLAEAGLLDGLHATTHWASAGEFTRRYPHVQLDPNVLYVDNGNILTSAGAASGLDLCLHIVQNDYGIAVAADAARLAVAPLHRPGGQAQFIVRNSPTHPTEKLQTVLAWIEEHAHEPITLDGLARIANTSPRTLTRRFQQETEQSPMQWVSGVRLRHAQELLETSDVTIDRIAARCGFSTTSNFRAQFAAVLGTTPGAYRNAFRP